MCFSAEASFTSAGVLTVIGSLTLREACAVSKEGAPNNLIYLGLIPLLFGVQQFFEGIVWVTMPPSKNVLLHTVAVQGFLFFAGMVWPTLIPYSLYKLEEDPGRKNRLLITVGLGIFVSLCAALSMLILGNEAQVLVHNIAYPLPLTAQKSVLFPIEKTGYGLILGCYVIATIGSSFISSVRYVWIFGVLALLGFIIAQIFYAHAFGSVWCFFAAIISTVCYVIVKKNTRST